MSSALAGADVTFVRKYHAKGETRQDGTKYENECYTTEIESFVEHIHPFADAVIKQAIKDNDVQVKKDDASEEKKKQSLALTWQW